MALIEMIGGGGVVSSLCLTQAYLPGAKQEEKKKAKLCLIPVRLRASGHLSSVGIRRHIEGPHSL